MNFRPFAFHASRPLSVGGGGGGVIQPGVRYYGACGHRDQGGIYTSRTIAQQAADLLDIFPAGRTLYRAVGDGQPHGDIGPDVEALQAQGIIPMVLAHTYPSWGSYANEAAAFAAAYSEVESVCANAPTAQLFDIGNEWNLQVGGTPSSSTAHQPSAWTGLSFYPLFLGALAGCVQAIRDNLPDAQIIGGATSGWVNTGFVPAMLDDLHSDYGLFVDFTCRHWYNGQSVNSFGLPDNVSGAGSGGANSYATMRPSVATPKPIMETEYGASVSGSSEATAASRVTGLLDNFYAQGMVDTGSALGWVGGCNFELYPHGVFASHYWLRNTDGSIDTVGQAVKDWIAAH